ncbi:MAG: SDR family oxidoreductase, partial [Perlucidibaca sp.]
WLSSQGADTEPLSAVRGDLLEPDAGISAADWQALGDVSVVYHSGALFAWNLTRASASAVNVDGTLRLLQAAATHLRLSRFVQVSGYMLTMHEHLRRLGITGDGSDADWAAIYARTGAYEASKLEAHFAVRRMARTLDVPLTVIHPATLLGHADSGELPETQEMARSIRQLLAGQIPAAPGGFGYRLPLVSVDYLSRFMAAVIDHPESAGREYLLADAATPDLKTVLTHCARAAGVSPPRLVMPVPLLRLLVRWPWLARRAGVSPEQVHFLRREPLDTTATEQLAERMGIHQPALASVLARTTTWLLAQPAV